MEGGNRRELGELYVAKVSDGLGEKRLELRGGCWAFL